MEFSEEQIVNAVADALTDEGLEASSQDTGGDMNCIVVVREDGGEIIWGTADVNWGAAIHDEEGEYVSAIQTDCRSDTRDVAVIVRAIKDASIGNGAVKR